jgi:hypothetical protein
MPYDNVRNQYHSTLVASTLIMLLTNVEMFYQKNQLEQKFGQRLLNLQEYSMSIILDIT